MADGALAGDLREAVEELQAYLSDLVAPLIALDSAQLLIAHSPELGAEVVRVWAAGQRRGPGAHGAAEYVFHAIRKLQLFAKLRLIEPEPLKRYLDGVIAVLIESAPPTEREPLRAYLAQATESEASLAPQVQLLHRPAAGPAPEPGPAAPADALSAQVSADLAASMRQFSLLLSRLERPEMRAGGDEARRSTDELAPQLLVAAAQSAGSQAELEQHLRRLSSAGMMTDVRTHELFATLTRSLPNWWLADAPVDAYQSASSQAMQRIVELTADPAHAATHFRELLNAVRDQVNAGALPRAVQVLEVVRRLLVEGKVEKQTADLMLATAHEELDPGQLMTMTQQQASLPLLRRLLNAYPALTPHGLLRLLDDEPDRSKRRLWIALLEAHGASARHAALERLEQSFNDPPASGDHLMWLQRNFVYLLHRIRPPQGEDAGREVALVVRCSDFAQAAPLVREALIDLGQRRHAEAETTLRQRLEQLERWLEQPAGASYDVAELRRLLNLVIAALARQGTPAARRAILEHGLSRRPAWGDTLERLGELGGYDLAEDPELVDRLLEALRGQLPVRVLGLAIRKQDGAQQIVRALQSTRSEAVRAAFQDVAGRFADQPFGQAAAAALANWGTRVAVEHDAADPAPFVPPAPAPSAGLAGDLEVFGLPELLQTLSQAESSGRLVLRSRAGHVVGEIFLHKGNVRDAKVRQLPMPDAFYQLMESTEPGTFEFHRQPAEATDPPVYGVMGLLMEGMRRYDDLQRARAAAPDHALLRPTGTRPTPPPDEDDGAFIRAMWTRLKESATPRQCEEAVAADAYRIRHLIWHWLTEGTLQIHEAAANAPP